MEKFIEIQVNLYCLPQVEFSCVFKKSHFGETFGYKKIQVSHLQVA